MMTRIRIFISLFLAILIALKYQKGEHVKKREGELKAAVQKIIDSEGVVDGKVHISYLDAEVYGTIENEQKRDRIVRKIDGLRGLRLHKKRNHLVCK